MIFHYDVAKLQSVLAGIIKRHVNSEVWVWLKEKVEAIKNNKEVQPFMIAFAATPRKTGKSIVEATPAEEDNIRGTRSQFSIKGWSIDRLSRVWLLLHLDATDKERYHRIIGNLFLTAEMNEQVALYSSLPLLAYPDSWIARCAEGVRSNMGVVLESIMCNNPYPSENLNEQAWNQLVLKAIFTEKPIHQIVNLDERANQNLASTLSDYAHERWAASRPVHPLLWRCVGKFINENIFPDIQRIALAGNSEEREAAALACADSTYKPARELLKTTLKGVIESGVTWDSLSGKVEKKTPIPLA